MKHLAYYILTLLLLSACRQDVMIVPMEKSEILLRIIIATYTQSVTQAQ